MAMNDAPDIQVSGFSVRRFRYWKRVNGAFVEMSREETLAALDAARRAEERKAAKAEKAAERRRQRKEGSGDA